MATQLETYLKDKKIDPRRLLAASRLLERLRPEDRVIRLTLRQTRRKEDAKRPEGVAKPRSGRPVSATTLGKALAGKPLSGPARTRILRAVNHILQQRKQPPAQLDELF